MFISPPPDGSANHHHEVLREGTHGSPSTVKGTPDIASWLISSGRSRRFKVYAI